LKAGHDHEPFVAGAERVDVEPAPPHRLDDVLAQHQVGDVGSRNQHALLAGQGHAPLQTSKKPSIFSLTPPTGCTWPR
jgi:hypothetical protein